MKVTTLYTAERGYFTVIVVGADGTYMEIEFDKLLDAMKAYELYNGILGYSADIIDNITNKWYIIDVWI